MSVTMSLADATIGLAAVTFVLACASAAGVWITYKALRTAQGENEEAIKSRIDARAPRVTIVAEAPGGATAEWPTGRGQIVPLPPAHPAKTDGEIGITGWFRLINEGLSTAIVNVPPNVLIAGGKDAYPVALTQIPNLRPTEPRQFPLRPEAVILVLAWACRTPGEWAKQARLPKNGRDHLTVTITSDDTYQDGVTDATDLHLHGVPISYSGEALMTVPEEPIWLAVDRTRRGYPNLPGQRRG